MKNKFIGEPKRKECQSQPPFMLWSFYMSIESFGIANTKTQTTTVLFPVLKNTMPLSNTAQNPQEQTIALGK